MTFKLPKFPIETTLFSRDRSKQNYYTADQMHEAYRQGLEDAAKVSEDTVTALCGLPDVARLIALGDDIASNIRKLKE